MNPAITDVPSLLRLKLKPFGEGLEKTLLLELEQGYKDWPSPYVHDERRSKPRIAQHLMGFIAFRLTELAKERTYLRKQYAEFSSRFSRATLVEEQRELILDFAWTLGANKRQLRGDRKAFSRWFGFDTIAERYQRRQLGIEYRFSFFMERMGVLCAHVMNEDGEAAGHARLWPRLNLLNSIQPFFLYDGDERVRVAAFAALTTGLQAVPRELQSNCVDQSALQYVYRSALETRQPTWIQTEALTLLQSLSLEALEKVLNNRLREPQEGDDLFVRAHAARLLAANVDRHPSLEALFPVIQYDPSPWARQALALSLPDMPEAIAAGWLPTLAQEDETPQVRAAAILTVPELLSGGMEVEHVAETLTTVMENEADDYVLRCTIKIVADAHAVLVGLDQQERAQRWVHIILPCMSKLGRTTKSIKVRRWITAARERIWVESDPEIRAIRDSLQGRIDDAIPGKFSKIRSKQLKNLEEDKLGRLLAVLSQEDFGFDVEPGRRGFQFVRGFNFGMRLWRFLYEVKNPSSDKRQAFRHTIGRVFHGRMRVPSTILCEVVETKVPGEPLYKSKEDSWRPYLPLVDDAISCTNRWLVGRPVRFYTNEGVTVLKPPRGPIKRIRAGLKLATDFLRISRLRNWDEGSQDPPDSYVKALMGLGFSLEFRPYGGLVEERWATDESISRFFPVAIPFGDKDWIRELQDYFFSVYENSLTELIIFSSAMFAWFIAKGAWAFHSIRKARSDIPLSLGGWGTRGKSGTERLKAGLINAMGYSIFSKTTGCEAMFLVSPPFGRTKELFLFRPYDKATIWEQFDVVKIAAKMKSHVFLWECMALTPDYVAVLQQQWMRDEIATLVNAYPDHEDLQGPAGINIPMVMTNFVSPKAIVLSSEEKMQPILKQAAHERGTRFRESTWVEAGLLTDDVVTRFPYEEHPNNIALVIALADELGLGRDYAVKEMADRVIADLGVLKTYTPAPIRTRHLQFTNGMSANERFGCLGNWNRLEFDKQDPYKNPGVWLCTVINNRADRVARSRVFASVLVNDLSADRHFIIGTNLGGMSGYIAEEWETYAGEFSLWQGDNEDPEKRLEEMAKRMRIPLQPEHLKDRLEVSLRALPGEPDPTPWMSQWDQPEALEKTLLGAGFTQYAPAIRTHVEREKLALDEYTALAAKVKQGGDRGAIDAEFRSALEQWYMRKIVVVQDSHTSGSDIISLITEETPPGYLDRIMGMQNIKGTGLDFAYCWQDWGAVYHACNQLESEEVRVMQEGIQTLMAFKTFNAACREAVGTAILKARDAKLAQNETTQAELNVIEACLKASEQTVAGPSEDTRKVPAWLEYLLSKAEALLDAGDAVKRRKRADAIYQDLVTERISYDAAARGIKALNKRQKGGWLMAQLFSTGDSS